MAFERGCIPWRDPRCPVRSRSRAPQVVGADGLRSRVARLVSAPVYHQGEHAAATIYGYWPDPGPGEYHWHFGDRVTAGAISTNDGLSCVFVGMDPGLFSRERAEGLPALHQRLMRRAAPELADAVAGPPEGSGLRAFPGQPGFRRRSAGFGWALVGDAGYFKDPATAHGITDALRDAELLARAALRGEDSALSAYQETRDRVSAGFLDTTDRIASLDWSVTEVQRLHRELSDQMNRRLELVRSLDTAPAAALS